MFRQILVVASTLLVGVILGFGILIFSEKKSAASRWQSITDASITSPSALKTDPARIAELKTEVARLEAMLARADNPAGKDPAGARSLSALPPRAVALPAPASGVPLSSPDLSNGTGTPGRIPRARKVADLEQAVEVLPAPPTLSMHARIEGGVVADETGRIIRAYTLGVKRDGGDWVRKDIQSARGLFQWTLDPGKVELFVSAPGYAEWHRTEMEMLAGAVISLQIRLRPKNRLEGHVIDAETGLPVIGAVLTLCGKASGTIDWQAKTDRDGWFSGQDPFLKGAPRTLRIMHGDYVTQQIQMPGRGPVKILLRRGDSALTGKVITAQDKPVYGAILRVFKDDPRQSEIKTVTTDLEGRFKISGLTPGRFLVWASARHFPGAVRIIDLAPGEMGVTEFRMREGLTLAGRVHCSARSESQLVIQAYDASGGFLMEVPVSRDNTFLFKNLTTGEITLEVHEKATSILVRSFTVQVPHTDGEVKLDLEKNRVE